jgi:hypothetical protein
MLRRFMFEVRAFFCTRRGLRKDLKAIGELIYDFGPKPDSWPMLTSK